MVGRLGEGHVHPVHHAAVAVVSCATQAGHRRPALAVGRRRRSCRGGQEAVKLGLPWSRGPVAGLVVLAAVLWVNSGSRLNLCAFSMTWLCT